MKVRDVISSACFLLLLSACGDPSKGEILQKAEGAKTKKQLEAALGRPDDIEKLGPIAKWTYEASDGRVIYIIAGDTVALDAAVE